MGNTGKDRLSLKHTAGGSHTLKDRRETREKTDYPWDTQPEDHTHSRIDGKHVKRPTIPETHSRRITHTPGSTGNTGKDRLSLKHTAGGSHTLQDRRETRVKTDYPWNTARESHTLQDRRETRVKTDYPWNTQPEDHTHSRIDGKHG